MQMPGHNPQYVQIRVGLLALLSFSDFLIPFHAQKVFTVTPIATRSLQAEHTVLRD